MSEQGWIGSAATDKARRRATVVDAIAKCIPNLFFLSDDSDFCKAKVFYNSKMEGVKEMGYFLMDSLGNKNVAILEHI